MSTWTGAYAEIRDLGDLAWMTPAALSREVAEFDETLARASAIDGALGRYARAARAILPLWAAPDMLWFDRDNPGTQELDESLRMAINPWRTLPWWLNRPADQPRMRGEEARRAYLRFGVGLVHHDITHLLVWIGHRRLPGFHTRWLGEELNCTLWGNTIAFMAVTGELPDLTQDAVLDRLVETAQGAIRAVHGRDYLADPEQMMSEGASMDCYFGAAPASCALMERAEELVPEHPAAPRAYQRFAQWAALQRDDRLDPAALAWRGHEGVTTFPPRPGAPPQRRGRAKRAGRKAR